MTFAADTCSETSHEKKIHLAEIRMLRWASGRTLFDEIVNRDIRERESESQGSVQKDPGKETLRWYGHMLRREEDHVTRRALEMKVEGRRKTGSLRRRWMD